jgi:NAD(P)-dependent dehydrogenase (short-subunit alcohol dehydrogenase family)
VAGGDLSGRVTLVTGAGRGIGRRIPSASPRQRARVALVARSEHELAEAGAEIEGGSATGLAVVADVADVNRLDAVAAEIWSELGPPTILVNNAAVVTPLGPTAAPDPDAITAVNCDA